MCSIVYEGDVSRQQLQHIKVWYAVLHIQLMYIYIKGSCIVSTNVIVV